MDDLYRIPVKYMCPDYCCVRIRHVYLHQQPWCNLNAFSILKCTNVVTFGPYGTVGTISKSSGTGITHMYIIVIFTQWSVPILAILRYYPVCRQGWVPELQPSSEIRRSKVCVCTDSTSHSKVCWLDFLCLSVDPSILCDAIPKQVCCYFLQRLRSPDARLHRSTSVRDFPFLHLDGYLSSHLLVQIKFSVPEVWLMLKKYIFLGGDILWHFEWILCLEALPNVLEMSLETFGRTLNSGKTYKARQYIYVLLNGMLFHKWQSSVSVSSMRF